jgi:two-component system chemotaxis response regulator CheY
MKNLNHKKILVVDDSATMRMLICMTLKKMMIPATEAVNGHDAINKLQEQDYDLVITDIMMPVMDGLQLINNIRSTMNKKTPIIIISTKGMEKDRDLGLSLGANDYIVKPIKGHELTEVIVKFLS